MPIFDTKHHRIIIRIVYDGPEGVGKSTNVWRLRGSFTPNRRSEVYSPVEIEGRTHFFDWLTVDGGTISGLPLRIQILSTPGRAEFARRRNQLLREADATVFVCESTQSGIAAAAKLLDECVARNIEREPCFGSLVIQANKQDLSESLPPEDVRRGLQLPEHLPCIGATACEGIGVSDAFVLAVRRATEHTRDLIMSCGVASIEGAEESAEDLVRRLADSAGRNREGAKDAPAVQPQSHTPIIYPPLPIPLQMTTDVVTLSSTEGASIESIIDCGVVLRTDLIGRQGIAEGSGTDDTFIYEASEWCLKTSHRRRYPKIEIARSALDALATRKRALGPLLPDRSVLMLQPDAQGYFWVWTISPWLTTLRSLMVKAAEGTDELVLGASLAAFARVAVRAIALAADQRLVLDIHPSNFAIETDHCVYIDDDLTMGDQIPSIGYNLLQRVDEYARFETAIDMYLLALEDALINSLTSSEVAKLGLLEAIDQTVVRTTMGRAARSTLQGILAQCPATLIGRRP